MLGKVFKKHIVLKPTQVEEFVKEAAKCDFDVDIYYNRYVVDAKSILGVFGLLQLSTAEITRISRNT